MRRNRLGFDQLGLRPRVLVDVSVVDTSTSFLGETFRSGLLRSHRLGLCRSSRLREASQLPGRRQRVRRRFHSLARR